MLCVQKVVENSAFQLLDIFVGKDTVVFVKF